MPVCGVVAAFFGVVFGAPTLRLRALSRHFVTLGFGEIVAIVARNTPYLTNGAIGLNGAAPPRLFGYSFGVASSPYYYLGLLMIGVLVFVSLRLPEFAGGAVPCMAIARMRSRPAPWPSTGPSEAARLCDRAAFGGMTGAFYVAKLQTATPDMFMFPVVVMILSWSCWAAWQRLWRGPGRHHPPAVAILVSSRPLTGWSHMLGRALGSAWLQRVDLVQSIELIFGIILVSICSSAARA